MRFNPNVKLRSPYKQKLAESSNKMLKEKSLNDNFHLCGTQVLTPSKLTKKDEGLDWNRF